MFILVSREALLFGEELCLTLYSVKTNNNFEIVTKMQTTLKCYWGIPMDPGKQTYVNRIRCNIYTCRCLAFNELLSSNFLHFPMKRLARVKCVVWATSRINKRHDLLT